MWLIYSPIWALSIPIKRSDLGLGSWVGSSYLISPPLGFDVGVGDGLNGGVEGWGIKSVACFFIIELLFSNLSLLGYYAV